jgi:hypothetical protein
MLSAMRQKFGGHVETGAAKPAPVKKSAPVAIKKPLVPSRGSQKVRRKSSSLR